MPTKKQSPTTPKYISQQDAADQLGVSVKTIRRSIAAGRLTGYRVGGRLLRVDQAEVAAMLRPIPTTAGTTTPAGR